MSVESLVDEMPSAVGRRVREARTARGLTLDQLAERSRVSRRMIINVEGGTANASIATLLRLATALQIALTELVEDRPRSGSSTIMRRAERMPLWRGELGGTAELVASSDMLELWDWTLQPGEFYESEAHRIGTRELIHVNTGRLHLVVAGEEHELQTGDGASFAADVAHSYGCSGRKTVRFAMTVLEPMARIRP
jgi:transcriptional regulator with XRE-family HTH domain